MTMIQIGLICSVAGLLATSALADDKPDCIDPQTQMEMTYCAGVDYDKADADLNALWPGIVAAAKQNDEYVADMARERGVPTTLEALRNAQRAWITFRDAQCEYEAYEVFGGTMQPMVGSLCLARLTRERIEVLSHALESR
ncbi:lysozyme inhibitor LprI family protein [Hoeflea alexandrii]|uniref:lysozyme inhibitor LprI family protein n=1 Tax=Hoeflea alexandrii TaxID=288436 RepID=UPI0022AEFC12|nr:lysozyme inhibitor LprI family protein [Hoeflea alexandrii]MCZ4288399.1 lysozyme inhibitor LprI family protein [Hoeflea alexandrii]